MRWRIARDRECNTYHGDNEARRKPKAISPQIDADPRPAGTGEREIRRSGPRMNAKKNTNQKTHHGGAETRRRREDIWPQMDADEGKIRRKIDAE